MGYGRPVVATAVGGLVDDVRDGVTGLLVPPCDPAALRAAIETLLTDGDLRRRLGDAGRTRVRERASWEATADAIIAVYRQALVT
jgi:glycosyltransferase involved in cell wall biosynthesis